MTSEPANVCELIAWNIFQALDLVCKNNAVCSLELRTFLAKQIWNAQDREAILTKLSQLFLNLSCAVDVGSYFRPLILDIAWRAKKLVQASGQSSTQMQCKLAVALGLVLPLCPELKRFTGDFISVFKPFSSCNESEEPKMKRKKKEKIARAEWCRALHNLATHLKEPGRTICISMVTDNFGDRDISVRWYAAQTYCTLTGMTEHSRRVFLRQHFKPQEEMELVHRSHKEMLQREQIMNSALGAVTLETLESAQTHTHHHLLPSDLDSGVVSVTGIVLPRLSSDDESSSALSSSSSQGVKHQWVGVPSMQESLHSLTLAVSAGHPVLVQGPVGCGKTLLVQHLAMLTGRFSTPHIIKVQLGDQTDSKALLGTYQCTEVPGQFVWRAGVLTEAVTRGCWLLLEDLDHAPMEVVSTLAPLLHTSTLSVPGHGDLIQAAPGFQLFATQRLFASGDGLHSQNKSSAILDKLWTQVTIQPLSRAELKQVVVTRFPNLPTVVDRLLDIYFMLSAGRHHMTSDPTDLEEEGESHSDESEENTVGKFLSLTGRLISTRDLMSWCSRVSSVFEPASVSSAELILQAAVDCFVSCLPSPTRRLALCKAIANHLNLTESTAEYFLSKRLPQVEQDSRHFTVGSITLACKQENIVTVSRKSKATFSYTRPAVCLLEKVATCVHRNEPILLVGETGTGKTSSVQFLAHTLGHKLHVINLNQQSDSVDLLGGFKPVDLKFLMMPLREEFEKLFCKTFSRKQNAAFLHHLQNCFTQKRWHDLLTLMEHSWQGAAQLMAAKEQEDEENRGKWQKQSRRWRRVGARIRMLKVQVQESENVLAFSFIEGTLVKALKAGDWVLLDEINLATAETLQCLAGLLESTDGSLVLTDRGTMDPVVRHPDFRLFACMNPATDVGKKDLTPSVRNRFTEFYVDELLEPEDLKMLVGDYLSSLSLSPGQLKGIVKFYTEIRQLAATRLVDGTGHKPHYSLRTLCRALRFIQSHNCGTVVRSLYEGFCLSFLTQLDRTSHPVVTSLICQHVLSGKAHSDSHLLQQPLPMPPGGKYLDFCGYWISQGELEPSVPEAYILTPSVKENLKDLARVVSAGSYPVLLQGETSVGKTSLITWLALSSGKRCLRVNNHEHTDLQEYVGCYAADESGKLVFKEGVLVEAMRKGHWIILDELNLAPTDVLEALNRLLDDNQELFIPETQEMVKAHPKFMLFATQNPPGHYGGRKMLSRAFRNRFVELHFDEIPKSELETILHQRCAIPPSYAKRLVAVMMELQVRRQQTGLFAGKQSWMTLRDLFRWAERYKSPEVDKETKFYNYDQHMADHGYMLLAGRVRKPEEMAVIQEVIEKHFKQCIVNPERLFDLSPYTSLTVRTLLETVVSRREKSLSSSSFCSCTVSGFEHVVWTQSMRRLAVLIGQAIQFGEPVLLVGDTGCGKTTVCQLYSALKGKKLHSVNCHLHTESADFLGGLRPVRSHTQEGQKQKLFEWVDGPLVTAMKEGSMFLIDEISLADDSVLERLNSVLEPERLILLAEKGGGESVEEEVEVVKAAEGFQVFATMNPGGDFGKKELSPALRNRFTEIWCPQSNSHDDLVSIIEHNIHPGLTLGSCGDGLSGFGALMLDFVSWFSSTDIGKRCTVSIRDILSWAHFINTCTRGEGQETGNHGQALDPAVAYIHGACLVFLDSLGAGVTSRGSDFDASAARAVCLTFLQNQVKAITGIDISKKQLGLVDDSREGERGGVSVELTPSHLTIFPFSLTRETNSDKAAASEQYAMQAPTTCVNAQRILRGLQLSRPLLLEGAPGVGKTSLVAAVARLAGRELVRINLSEQTDVTDLFGADLPVEGGTGGSFAWRDGPFLQALKAGHWVVFDEMNLASQSVLEGLNACLDHRGEVFIPELGRTFHIQHGRTRIFACQNPLNQGGGRKGLPRSFLNRFTQVYVEPLSRTDLIFICTTVYPSMPKDILTKMVDFNMKMHEETMVYSTWGHKGAPWEFNLRDINRWCDLLLANQGKDALDPGEYVGLVYQDRMRTTDDKQRVAQLFSQTFGEDLTFYLSSRVVRVGPCHVQAGHAFLKKKDNCRRMGDGEGEEEEGGGMMVLHHSLAPLESLMTCVNMGWMVILVGSSSCGKSSLVRLLSELSGHTLHVLPVTTAMDTIELLGGFEQVDIGRHVAELTGEVMQEVRAYQRQCSVRGDVGAVGVVASLDQQLMALRTESEEDPEDSSKEKETLLSHIQKLQKLVAKLSNLQPSSERLPQLSQSLKHEQQALEKVDGAAGSVGGGAFEWVDSLLVKALRQGHWLLIDNVNFCSPSVLDRLNALLEPRGVLTINERGVTDGTVPTITPHPEFRLFLSMDPKFGEISRAMRNRGVEIYILGETDGCPYNTSDTLSMLQGLGLNNQLACDWLMSLHAQLRDRLMSSEKPSLSDLLRCAVQAKQLQEKGVEVVGALSHATRNVYVCNMKSLAARQVVCSILTKQLSELNEQMIMMKSTISASSSSLDRWVDWATVAPSVGQFQSQSGLASAQQAARVFVSLLSKAGLEKFKQTTQAHRNSSDHYLRGLQTAFGIFLAHQNAQNWTLAWQWVKTCTQQRKDCVLVSLTSDEERELVERQLGWLMEMGEAFLEEVFMKGAGRALTQLGEELCQKESLASHVLSDMVWDHGTNLQALQMVQTAVKQQLHKPALAVTNTASELLSAVYRLELLLEMKMLMDPMRDGIAFLEQLCQKAHRQRSESSKVLNELCELFRELMAHLSDLVMHIPEESLHLLHQAQDRLLWLPRLLEETVSSDNRGEVQEVYLSQVALHWTWCWTLCLKHLVTAHSAPAVSALVNRMQSLLGEDHTASKVFNTFWSSWERPNAFPTETVASRWQDVSHLASALAFEGSTPLEAAQQKLRVLETEEGRVMRLRLAFVAQRLLSGDLDVESDLTKLQEFLLSQRLLRSETRTDAIHLSAIVTSVPNEKTEDIQCSCVPLWPVYEHLALLAALSSVLGVSEGKERDNERRQQVQDFEMYCSPSAICLQTFKEQDLSQGERMRWLLHILRRLWTSPAVTQCAQWLNWGTQPTSHDAEPLTQEVCGPAVFHRSGLLLYASHLLASAYHGNTSNSLMISQYNLLPLNVTLGGIESQLTRLSDFTRCLWKHGGLLSSDYVSLRRLEEESLTQMFLSLLTALTPLIDCEAQEAWIALVHTLKSMKDTSHTHNTSLFSCWRQNQAAVKSCLVQLRDHLKQHSATLTQKDETPATANSTGLSTLLARCFELMAEAMDLLTAGCAVAGVGSAMVYVAMALLHLLSPKGPVDPVHKASVELAHYRKELLDVETDLEVWESHLKLTMGQGMADISPTLHHPRLSFLLRRRTELVSAISQLEKQHAFRGDRTQYLRLSRDVETLVQTAASASTVAGLVSRLCSLAQAGKAEFCTLVAATTTVLREEQTWQVASGRFSTRLCEEYPCLPDLTVPVCLAVEQMRLGMRMLSQEASLKLKQVQKQYWPGSGQLDAVVSHLSSFPSVQPTTPTWLHLASVLSSPATRETVGCLLPSGEQNAATHGERVLSRLLSCSLHLVKIHAQQTGELTPDLFTTLMDILEQYVKTWQDQEDRRRAKEEEEATLYRFKDQTHGDGRTEEEREEDAFRKAFPSFHDFYADMVEVTRLEDTGEKRLPMDKECDRTNIPDSITEQEMDLVCTSHVDLLHQLTSSTWLKGQWSSGLMIGWEVVKPALLAYQVATDVGRQSWELLSEQVDKHSLGSHLIVCGTLAHSLQAHDDTDASSQVSQVLRPPSDRCYNVYVDPNVAEVMQCRSVLTHMVSRVKELQRVWPANPILLQLQQLVERIESFPVLSPVIKFLTGMELLLEKAQHWERNAASHVSMATQLSEVTAIIVRWRKLELRCWSGALDIEVERCRRKASRWWFHLYTLTATYLAHAQIKEEVEKLLQSLKQFMEGSTLGEFTARLDMILAFHCHLLHTLPSPQRDRLLPLLWNLHQFYSQFRTAVVDEIARLRSPIEKELKGFVKIARWSEMNYWALKESTEKTHRTVHKHARAFQGLLNQPVRGLLGEKMFLEPNDNRSSGTFSSSYSQQLMDYHQQCLKSAAQPVIIDEVDVQPLLQQLPGCSLQHKLPSLCQRAGKHWKRFLQQSTVCEDIAALDDLTGELIQATQELQKLEAPQGADKEKQRSEVRHIHQRKRKALADGFKQLTALGLSFKKGLLKGRANPVDEALFSAPLNPAACLEKGSALHTLWEGCDSYFTQCLSRLAQFSVALQSPSKELGMDNIQRCQGYAEHLTVVFMKQREQLADTFSHLMSFRKLTTAVERLRGRESLAPQDETRQWLERVKQEVTQLIQGLTQFGLVLQACPSAPSCQALSGTSHGGLGIPAAASPFPPDSLGPMARMLHGDDLWNKCWTSVQAYLETASKLQAKLLSLTHTVLFTGEDINSLSSSVTQLMAIASGLHEMTTTLNHHHHHHHSLLSALVFLTSSIHKLHTNYSAWMQFLTETDRYKTEIPDFLGAEDIVADFSESLEGLVQSVLLCVQKLVKSREEEEGKEEKLGETAEVSARGDGEESVRDCHLVSLVEQLQKHVSYLDLGKLTKSLNHLCEHLKDMTTTTTTVAASEINPRASDQSPVPSMMVPACAQLLVHCVPVLKVYLAVVENKVGQCLALHRTLGKMLSVMLAIFTQLVLKGFCLPSEYTEDADGESATDFVNIEGGGIGEGEGSKDVSEQIESEDQLDETKLPGQEENEDQQTDISPEENAIEMSEDFDAKPQNLEPVEGDKDEEEDDKEEEDMDKQMGEVDGPDSDRLDDQMWGSDEEDNDKEDDKPPKEEEGPGSGPQGEKEELKARDNSLQRNDPDEDDKQQEEKREEENMDEPKPQDLQDFDENEYDDSRIDPHHGENDKGQEPENMDLPEELKLDQDEQDEGEDGDEQTPLGEEGEELTDFPPDMTEEEKVENGAAEKEEGEENEGQQEEQDNENGGAEEENKDTAEGDKEEAVEDGSPEEERGEAKEEEEKKRKAADEEEGGEDEGNSGESKGFHPQEKMEGVEEVEGREVEERQQWGQTSQDTVGALQNTDAENNATGDNDQDEKEGVGQTTTDQHDGHEGSSSAQLTQGATPHNRKQSQRCPGQSKDDRSLGSADAKFRRLKTTEHSENTLQPDRADSEDQEAEMYQHIREDTSHADAQTLDAATDQQHKQQAVVGKPEEEEDEGGLDDDDDVKMREEEEEKDKQKSAEKTSREGAKHPQNKETSAGGEERDGDPTDVEEAEIEGSVVQTMDVERPHVSTIHTHLQHLHFGATMSEADMERLRSDLQSSMTTWSQANLSNHEAVSAAAQAWQQYEALTSSLSQELCEQLRLVLEPAQATKLRGDYRTGKRLNMRKVIPYIASQFRKDKIWLRRTKPSKRQYQIMLAIDDSSSMADNHSKQLAFESLALTANALTLLETGELGVCSFGETVQLLHPFTEPFSNQAGARILQQFTFEQKQTRVALMLEQVTGVMLEVRSRQQGWMGRPETAQLLLIVSDGRGINSEGMGVVRQAVRKAREANIFVVFVILDDPKNKNSIMDIRITTFNQGKPVFLSYMEEFPFPFYVILRDINSLPQVLSDALRQWFELVTASVT